jgi:hypothetical protein
LTECRQLLEGLGSRETLWVGHEYLEQLAKMCASPRDRDLSHVAHFPRYAALRRQPKTYRRLASGRLTQIKPETGAAGEVDGIRLCGQRNVSFRGHSSNTRMRWRIVSRVRGRRLWVRSKMRRALSRLLPV